MPRYYDYAHDPELSRRDYIFSVFDRPRVGLGEVPLSRLSGPHGIFLFDGATHQFRLQSPETGSIYDNALVDPVFDWLSANVSGAWNWLEIWTNNGRSVATHVYLAEAEDIDAFRKTWGRSFSYDERDTERNAAWEDVLRVAREDHVLPAHVTAERMKYVLVRMDDEAAEFFDDISNRDGFDAMFTEALRHATSYLLESTDTRHGPRDAEGVWRNGVEEAFVRIGQWVATSGSPELRTELAEAALGDDALDRALYSGLNGSEQTFSSAR